MRVAVLAPYNGQNQGKNKDQSNRISRMYIQEKDCARYAAMNHPLTKQLEQLFAQHADSRIAFDQAAYMKNKFVYYGIPKPQRARLQKECFKSYPITSESELVSIIDYLWTLEQREFQYAAMDLSQKYHKLWTPDMFELFEKLIRTKSWWDTVDTIASNIIGKLLFNNPNLQSRMDAWIADPDFWVRRTALIYQLRYKSETNHEKLFLYCAKTMHEKEFFIRKAIGWALREYSKTSPGKAQEFIETNKSSLSGLSIKEGSKYLL